MFNNIYTLRKIITEQNVLTHLVEWHVDAASDINLHSMHNCYILLEISAMKTLGVVGFEEVPAGGDTDKISFETFLKEA